jgi:rubredoxin
MAFSTGCQGHRLMVDTGINWEDGQRMNAYMCLTCDFVYDEEEGDLESAVEPGTRWTEIAKSWRCPNCGAAKEDFEVVEI